jgi:hypothetical protein
MKSTNSHNYKHLENNQMKRIIKTGLILFASVIGLTSCLEDKGYTDIINGVGAEPIVSIFGADGGALRVQDFKLGVAKEITYKVNLGSPEVLSKDVTVTLGPSQTGLDFQNAKRKAAGDPNYVVLPASTYSITPNPVVIKAGTRDAEFKVKITVPTTLDFANEYLLPIGITNAGDVKISGNLGFVNIGIGGLPNAYEGNYRAVGFFQHPTVPRAIDQDKSLKSIDKTTCETQFADLGGYVMWLKVNKDNTVTLIPKAGADGLSDLQQTGTNIYDPVKKQFTLNYKYVGGNGDRVISEVLSRK